MDEFKDVMYCPFCDKYLPKKEWFCIFCLHNTINYESWKYKSILTSAATDTKNVNIYSIASPPLPWITG